MKPLLSLFLALIALSARGQGSDLELWQRASVKIKSFVCGAPNVSLHGSAFLVKAPGAIYVLTSEHVVLHDDSSSVCHSIALTGGDRDFGAKLLRVSFVKGLALLELTGNPDQARSFALDEARLVFNQLGVEKVLGLGFPHGSHQLQVLKDGKVLNFESARSLVPDVHKMIETSSMPVEYGMSGGLLIGQDSDGRYGFLGMLSHQVLTRQAGGVSVIGPPTGDSSDLALSIPAGEIIQFLSSPEFGKSHWQRSLKSQLGADRELYFGPLVFKLSKASISGVLSDVDSIAGSGIGGADGTGIGGADGVGIGGEARSPNTEIVNSVRVELRPFQESEKFLFNNQTLELWHAHLLRGEKIYIPFLAMNNNQGLRKFSSFEHLVSEWRRQNAEPLLMRSYAHTSLEDGAKAFYGQSSKTLILIQTLKDQNIDPSLANWLSMYREKVLLLRSGHVSVFDFTSFMDSAENVPFWQKFYENDFDAATSLEASLYALRAKSAALFINRPIRHEEF